MTARPTVSVYATDSEKVTGSLAMPTVFTAPIRDDLVQFCHSNMAKNRRQGHAVFWHAGHEHSAESWGTGRAVARIPRISGSGTHRSGQGAFGNMCRKGRMFAPLKIWRKWQRKVNTNQKRNAVASALAAAACGPLVMARGHKIDDVPELPLVVDSLNKEKTSQLLKALGNIGVGGDLNRARTSKNNRAGAGKMRNARFTLRKGPLVVYGDENPLVKQSARNLPGVDVCNVSRLNLLQLAPGGHLGRLVVFTQDAFAQLDNIFGTYREAGVQKSGFKLGRNMMSCADLARIINSDQIQSKLRMQRVNTDVSSKGKKNPLTNKTLMQRLNPAAKALKEAEVKAVAGRTKARAAALKEKRSKAGRKAKAVRTGRFNALADGLETSFKDAHQAVLDEIKAGLYNVAEDDEEEEQ
jgi:large subunit ribosomal protein L4e